MSEIVKRDGRAARREETELRLVAAATALFVERGYAATALTDVAAEAGVAPRTLYLHFATKAELLLRAIGVAITGDTTTMPIGQRDWMIAAMEAPSLDERIDRMASVTAGLMARAGALIDVAQQAAPSEPAVAAAAAAGRNDTTRTLREFWRRMAADGLLPKQADVDWLADTASVFAQAEVFLLQSKTNNWTTATYEQWLATSWRRMVRASG